MKKVIWIFLAVLVAMLLSFTSEARTLKAKGVMLEKYVEEFYNSHNLKFTGIIRYSTKMCDGTTHDEDTVLWGSACTDTHIIHINPELLKQHEFFLWAVVMHELAHIFGVEHVEDEPIRDENGPMMFYDKVGYNYVGRYCKDSIMAAYNDPDELVPCMLHEDLGKDYYRSQLGDLLLELGHKTWHDSNNTKLEAQ